MVKILLVKLKKPRSIYTGFPKQEIRKRKEKNPYYNTSCPTFFTVPFLYLSFVAYFYHSRSLLRYISCHGNDVIVCKTTYCPWKGIHDKTEQSHVLKREAIGSSCARTRGLKIVTSKYCSTTFLCP